MRRGRATGGESEAQYDRGFDSPAHMLLRSSPGQGRVRTSPLRWDIAKALIGQRVSNERIVVLEARHKDLQLKDLGATDGSGGVTTISWSICGRVFVLLEQDSDPATVYDAIEAQTPSADDLLLAGSCKLNGKEMNDSVTAVLNWPPGSNPLKLRVPGEQDGPCDLRLEDRREGPEIRQDGCRRPALPHLRRAPSARSRSRFPGA